MTFKVKTNDPYFQYQPRVSQDACLMQIWGFQLKFMTSYHVDKVKFMDGHTNAGNDNTPWAWKAKANHSNYVTQLIVFWHKFHWSLFLKCEC